MSKDVIMFFVYRDLGIYRIFVFMSKDIIMFFVSKDLGI